MKKMFKKCSTDQSFIRKRNTTYKIGTLMAKQDADSYHFVHPSKRWSILICQGSNSIALFLQKTCTLVSKTWFDEIRDSTTLSGEMTLKTTWPWWKVKDINQILSQWTKLRVLRMTNERQ